jgi:two-component system sensor histidine kinase AlgZ
VPVKTGRQYSSVIRADVKEADSQGEDANAFFLPDFCERWNLLLVILIAELLAIVLALAQPGGWLERLRFLAVDSLFVQWVALTDAAVLCSCRKWFSMLGNRGAAVAMFVVLQLVTLCFTLLTYGLLELLALSLTLAPGWLVDRLVVNVLISVTVTAVALRYFYVQHQWKLNVEAEARSRIAELQARIRPHFLFNSMNTIASLARSDPRKTEQVVEDLAEVFRATLAKRDRLTLAEELELARSYLRIEALRLGERLQVEWHIDPDVEQIVVPALTLQPLVENAVYHGIETLPDGGVITITARRDAERIVIEIANPIASAAATTGRTGNQLALTNIEQRLQLMFGRNDVLDVGEYANRFEVRLRLPARISAIEKFN